MFGQARQDCSAVAHAAAPAYVFRRPEADDGATVSGLISACPPLDENSRYCNLLQCSDFADTCVLAEQPMQDRSRPVGWVSGYRPPREPQTLFVWQVAVHPEARGAALGKRMILSILARDACAGIRVVKTTVTPGNHASRSLFRKLARSLSAPMEERLLFDRRRHFLGHHESERLITIGPFRSTDALHAASENAVAGS